MPVLVKINNKPDVPWRINMMPVGDGNYYLYLHGHIRKASNTKVGDSVNVNITFDSNYKSGPMHPMQDWFRKPLEKNLKAKENWKNLTPSRKKEILRYFSWIKSEEAKNRNVERVLNVLSGKSGRFMAQSWKDGKVITYVQKKSNKISGEEKLNLIEKAIILLLKKQKEISFKDLIINFEKQFEGKFEGSIRYYALTAKLVLQNKGIIEQIPESKQTILRLKQK
jgi:hypothetical protein